MKKTLLFLGVAISICACAPKSTADIDKPFGWCTCSDYQGTRFETTGGYALKNPKTITLTSNADDMMPVITKAIEENDIVILDGSAGPFIFSSGTTFCNLCNKTIIGINGAKLFTKFMPSIEVANEIKAFDDSLKHAVFAQNFDAEGNPLDKSIDKAWLQNELEETVIAEGLRAKFREKGASDFDGCFYFSQCNNIIVRNLSLKGPGAAHIENGDLITLAQCRNVWIDHCNFVDGSDENLDLSSCSYITVSWCYFDYSEISVMGHRCSCLCCGPEGAISDDLCNTTFAFCHFGDRIHARGPMGDTGTYHVFNCLYTCKGEKGCLNPRINSKFLVENCYFDDNVIGYNPYKEASRAQTWRGNIFNRPLPEGDRLTPKDHGEEVKVPYQYTLLPADKVKDAVLEGAGPTNKIKG